MTIDPVFVVGIRLIYNDETDGNIKEDLDGIGLVNSVKKIDEKCYIYVVDRSSSKEGSSSGNACIFGKDRYGVYVAWDNWQAYVDNQIVPTKLTVGTCIKLTDLLAKRVTGTISPDEKTLKPIKKAVSKMLPNFNFESDLVDVFIDRQTNPRTDQRWKGPSKNSTSKKPKKPVTSDESNDDSPSPKKVVKNVTDKKKVSKSSSNESSNELSEDSSPPPSPKKIVKKTVKKKAPIVSTNSSNDSSEDKSSSSEEIVVKKVKGSKAPKGKAPRKLVAKTVKKKKDPNAPKKNLSAYMFYRSDRHPQVKKKYPQFKFGEVNKQIGADWKKLSEKEKEPYVKKAEQDKKRYQKALKAYEQNKLNSNSDSSKDDSNSSKNSTESDD